MPLRDTSHNSSNLARLIRRGKNPVEGKIKAAQKKRFNQYHITNARSAYPSKDPRLHQVVAGINTHPLAPYRARSWKALFSPLAPAPGLAS